MSTLKIYTDGNHYEFEYEVNQRDEDTGIGEGAPLLTLRGRLALTRNGATIHASLDVPASPRLNEPNLYFGRFEGPNLQAHCAAFTRGFLRFYSADGAINVNDPVEFLPFRES